MLTEARRQEANPDAPFYSVVFKDMVTGMVLKEGSSGEIVVSKLQKDREGRPGPALATGKIARGDVLIAIDGYNVMEASNVDEVADFFQSCPRPMEVLFERVRVTRDATKGISGAIAEGKEEGAQ